MVIAGMIQAPSRGCRYDPAPHAEIYLILMFVQTICIILRGFQVRKKAFKILANFCFFKTFGEEIRKKNYVLGTLSLFLSNQEDHK